MSRLLPVAILLFCTTALADPLGVAWMDGRPSSLSPELATQPLENSTLVIGPLSATWPEGLQPVRVPGKRDLLLVEQRGDSSELAQWEILPGRTPYALLALSTADWTRLPLDLHGQQLRYRKPRGKRSAELLPLSAKRVDLAIKAAIVDAVDAGTLEQSVRELAGDLNFLLAGSMETIPERHSCRPGIGLAADYLQDRLEIMGYAVSRQSFPIPNSTRCIGGATGENIIATKIGRSTPEEIVVVGAHYDSISTNDDPDGPAPGAEDNGSGTAAVLHLASIFADYDTERTIQFVLFGGEEQNLLGSEAFVDAAVLAGDTIVAALTMDMMSAWLSNYRIDIEGWDITDPCGCWDLMLLFEQNIQATSPGLSTIKTYPGFGSDHVPFRNAQIPTFLAIESDYFSYPGYHRTTDTPEKLDYQFGRDVVRGMAATLADLVQPTEAIPVLVSGFDAVAVTGGLRIAWNFSAQSGNGTLRLERSVEAGAFQPLEGAAWSLSEQPGSYVDALDGITAGTKLHYRLLLDESGETAVVASLQRRAPTRSTASIVLRAPEPNPFSSSGGSLLRFRLARAGVVRMELFDAAGRRVRSLVDERLPAGEHERSWDGRDFGGREVSAGVYFIQLRSGAQVRARRLVKLR